MSRVSCKVRRIVADIALRPRWCIRPDTRLDDLGLDMLDRMEIVVTAHRTMGACVEGENEWRTVGDVITTCRDAVMYGDCHHGADT